MKRDLRGMIGNQLILDGPPIPKFIVYLLMAPMYSIFTLAIKLDCLFLAIFSKFSIICELYFDKLAHL